MTTYRFKGGALDNRYKLTATLTLKSPLHIGDGEMTSNTARLPKTKKMKKIPEFSTVMLDHNRRAYIPASTLKGNLRSWLAQIFSAYELAAPNTSEREKKLRTEWEKCVKENKTEQIHNTLKLAEYLFGSGLNEGKLEFQDAFIKSPTPSTHNNMPALAGYDGQRGTMILKGVAIDPVSGTAADKKLYNYEAVPSGTCFSLTVTGQNLSDAELGMLLFALEGFNSEIFPITLGAMAGIGFGLATFKLDLVYRLDKDNLKDWLDSAIIQGHAGYTGLTKLLEKDWQEAIDKFRTALLAKIKAEG